MLEACCLHLLAACGSFSGSGCTLAFMVPTGGWSLLWVRWEVIRVLTNAGYWIYTSSVCGLIALAFRTDDTR